MTNASGSSCAHSLAMRRTACELMPAMATFSTSMFLPGKPSRRIISSTRGKPKRGEGKPMAADSPRTKRRKVSVGFGSAKRTATPSRTRRSGKKRRPKCGLACRWPSSPRTKKRGEKPAPPRCKASSRARRRTPASASDLATAGMRPGEEPVMGRNLPEIRHSRQEQHRQGSWRGCMSGAVSGLSRSDAAASFLPRRCGVDFLKGWTLCVATAP